MFVNNYVNNLWLENINYRLQTVEFSLLGLEFYLIKQIDNVLPNYNVPKMYFSFPICNLNISFHVNISVLE